MRLDGRVLLVTGGGRAIGRRIALRAADEGADVAVLGPLGEELDAVADEIRGFGRRAVSVAADVSDEPQVAAAVQRVRADLGRIDVLVNNAAIIGPTAPVHNGASRQEIVETLLHIAPYAGFPAAWEGLALAAQVFGEAQP